MTVTKDILTAARRDHKRASDAWSSNRNVSQMSIEFVDGKQWPDSVRNNRESQDRPCLVINKIRKFVKQMVGDARQNMPSMGVRPVDSEADPEGAEVRNDIIRMIEEKSNATDAYDLAFEQALDGGFGYFRIMTQFEDDGFDQEIIIKPIRNRFTVYLDPMAQDTTYRDGQYAFISTRLTMKEFERLYPNATPSELSDLDDKDKDIWFEDDSIRVSEYFWMKSIKKTLLQLSDGSIIERTDDIDIENLTDQLGNTIQIIKERTFDSKQVMWVKITGTEILEGPKKVPGKYIPIVPVLGYEVNNEGRREFRSLIFDAMDSQRMYNYWRTHVTEIVTLAPKTPYKLTPEQVEGHQGQWEKANVESQPYLLYNNIPGQPVPQRERQVEIPTAAVNEANVSSNDIKDTIGRFEASLGQASNERSGRAILARKQSSDATTFTFSDNLVKAIKHSSDIVLHMIPEIYDTERIIRFRDKDGKEQAIPINKVFVDSRTGEIIKLNDLSVGKYDIVASIGPSSQTKRMETASSMLDFIQFVPAAAPVLGPMLAEIMDWPGSDKVAELLKEALGQQENATQQVEGNIPQQ